MTNPFNYMVCVLAGYHTLILSMYPVGFHRSLEYTNCDKCGTRILYWKIGKPISALDGIPFGQKYEPSEEHRTNA